MGNWVGQEWRADLEVCGEALVVDLLVDDGVYADLHRAQPEQETAQRLGHVSVARADIDNERRARVTPEDILKERRGGRQAKCVIRDR